MGVQVVSDISPMAYLLCCSPRTGSWLIAEGLADTGIAGNPDEYFSEEHEIQLAGEPLFPIGDAVRRWLAAVREQGTTPNGVLGLKAHLDQLEHLLFRMALERSTGPSGTHGGATRSWVRATLDTAFPSLSLIWTRRRDKVRQAVSWGRALQTGVWFAIDNLDVVPHRDPTFRPDLLERLYRRLLVQEAAWREFFTAYGVEPIVVDYEDLEHSYLDVLADVIARLGLASPAQIPPPRLRKQSDDLSEDWVRRLRALVAS